MVSVAQPLDHEFESLLRRVDRNSEVCARLDRVVERRLQQGRLGSAIAWARVSASFQSTNPGAEFRALRLERVLDAIARSELPSARPRSELDTGRVLHVLSEAHLIGGHRSMALRWVRLDRSRTGSFVVTRPGLDDPSLHEAAAEAGGEVHVLGGSLLERARVLRELAGDVDVVVCHTHNDDTVPAMAFGGDYAGAPVVLVNHADHVFFLGVGNVSTVANLRWTGADFSERARGFPPRSFRELPIPVEEPKRSASRAEARRALGIADDRVVALTLARPKKFLPSPLHSGFIELAEPALRDSGVLLLAVGPSLEEPAWAELAARSGDSVRVEGLQADPRPYLDAADIYLDSVPFSSNTSMLEAAFRGVPILVSRQYQEFQRLHGSDGVLDGVVVTAPTAEAYREQLCRLAADAELRAELGERTGDAVRSIHGEAAWIEAMERVYAHAHTARPVVERHSPPLEDRERTREYAAALLGIESATPLLWSTLTATAEMDRRDRRAVSVRAALYRAWRRLRGGGDPIGPDGAKVFLPR